MIRGEREKEKGIEARAETGTNCQTKDLFTKYVQYMFQILLTTGKFS